MKTTNGLSIGKLAAAASVNVETIRYYQRRGLLKEPAKPPRGQRRYASSDIIRICFIKRAQELGFTLAEITGLLLLEDGQSCRETRVLAEAKLEEVEGRIDDLTRMRRTLRALIAECNRGTRPTSCPIIIALSTSKGQRQQSGVAAND